MQERALRARDYRPLLIVGFDSKTRSEARSREALMRELFGGRQGIFEREPKSFTSSSKVLTMNGVYDEHPEVHNVLLWAPAWAFALTDAYKMSLERGTVFRRFARAVCDETQLRDALDGALRLVANDWKDRAQVAFGIFESWSAR